MGITVEPDFLGKLVNWDFVAKNFAAAKTSINYQTISGYLIKSLAISAFTKFR
jgi:hypothetical protein